MSKYGRDWDPYERGRPRPDASGLLAAILVVSFLAGVLYAAIF